MTWGLEHHVYVEDNGLVDGLVDRGRTQLFLNVASSHYNKQLPFLCLLLQQMDEKKM